MAEAFFVPTVDGKGRMDPEKAEEAWQACRKGVEDDHPDSKASERRIYRLRYVHDGNEIEAVVGEPDFYDEQTVMAIVSLPRFYKVCLAVRGYLKVGDTPMVGNHHVHEVEDFDPASY
jgi:hypothetical protein